MVKRLIQKRESKRERQERYAKRSKGLQKKVYELSTLCDVDVGLIMCAPNGKLKHYSNQSKIEKVLQEFIQGIPNMPQKEREKFVCLQTSQDIIDMINKAAGPDDVADQQGCDAPQREEVNREIIELRSKLMLLQEQERMLDPTMGTLNSEQEREEHINRLRENALIMIAKRKEELMLMQGPLTRGTNPSLRVQQQIESMQGSGTHHINFSSSKQNMHTKLLIQQPQLRIDTGMWDRQQGGKQLQVNGVPLVGRRGPSSSSPSFWITQSQAGIEDGRWVPTQRGEQQLLRGIPERFGLRYLSSSVPSIDALQYSQQPQHGMALSGSEQPSSNLLSQPVLSEQPSGQFTPSYFQNLCTYTSAHACDTNDLETISEEIMVEASDLMSGTKLEGIIEDYGSS